MTLLLAGDLNRRIAILRPTRRDDGYATIAGEPEVLGTRMGAKRDVSDRERLAAAQYGGELTTRFTVRQDSMTATIDSSCLIDCDGKRYAIVGVKELERRGGLEIAAVIQSS